MPNYNDTYIHYGIILKLNLNLQIISEIDFILVYIHFLLSIGLLLDYWFLWTLWI